VSGKGSTWNISASTSPLAMPSVRPSGWAPEAEPSMSQFPQDGRNHLWRMRGQNPQNPGKGAAWSAWAVGRQPVDESGGQAAVGCRVSAVKWRWPGASRSLGASAWMTIKMEDSSGWPRVTRSTGGRPIVRAVPLTGISA